MPAQGRGNLLTALGAVLVLGLGSVGCQNQFAVTDASGAPYNAGRMREQGTFPADSPGGSAPSSDVIRTSYESGPATGNRPPTLRGSDAEIIPVDMQTPLGPPTGGCYGNTDPAAGPGPGDMGAGDRPPSELAMVSHPPYMIEPPDILLLDAIRLVPRPPYMVQPLDVLLIRVADALPNQPVNSVYTVSPDGTVNLGFTYGTVRVAGMTLEMVQEVVRRQLGRVLRNPQVAVALTQFRGLQQLRGEHLVRQDGTISLGTYGCVYVTGLTLAQARCAIEKHLAPYMIDPQVSLDVCAYNSKVYYIITDGGGYGQQVYRLPITGKETVLDCIANIQGLPPIASTRRIWVARPAPADHACTQILPVDWHAITEGGSTATNYQIFPGDRIYVKADCLIAIDNWLCKVLSPFERLFGITLLGNSTVHSFDRRFFNGTGNGTAAGVAVVGGF